MKKILSILIALTLVFLSGCNVSDSVSYFYFNAPIDLNFYDGNGLDKRYQEIQALLSEIHNVTDCENEDSDVSKFNKLKVGESIEVSNITLTLLKVAKTVYDATDGAYNPFIYPLTELWQFTADKYKKDDFVFPSDEAIEIAKDLCNINYVKIDGNKLTKLKDGVKLDLGGITKGFASDVLQEYLTKNGFKQGYVSMGTSSILLFENKQNSKLNLKVRHPDFADKLLIEIKLKDVSVSTSGVYERYYNYGEKKYSHILDVKTGKPIDNGMKSVTVICKNGAFADALSTALCVMGSDKAISFINEYNKTATDKLIVIFAYELDGVNYCYTNAKEFKLLDESYTLIK